MRVRAKTEEEPMRRFGFAGALIAISATIAADALAQACPEKNLLYWQAFPAGGESDISARHQQAVLRKNGCSSL